MISRPRSAVTTAEAKDPRPSVYVDVKDSRAAVGSRHPRTSFYPQGEAMIQMQRAAKEEAPDTAACSIAAQSCAVLEPHNVLHIDDCDLSEARAIVAAFGTGRYGYVVTANVDHVIRYYHTPTFREFYGAAAYVLLDSRFLVHVLRVLKRQILRASPGSDLTAALFEDTIRPQDVVLVVGGAAHQAQMLRERYGLKALRHISPPMNLMHDSAAIEACLRDIEAASPFRFCFIALGSPLQEMIAYKLQERATARGLALCVGAAINYLTGAELRAPPWMRWIGFEWLFRLLQQPRRMAYRYLIRGPRIFWLAARVELRLRRPGFLSSDQEILQSSVAPDMISVIDRRGVT